MMEAEKGSVELVTACILQNGVDCSPRGRRRARNVEGVTYTRTHGSARPWACLISTHIMSNLCSALQFPVRRRKFYPARLLSRSVGCEKAVFRPAGVRLSA